MAGGLTILGIESTCDETAAAVVRGGRDVLSNVVASQAEIHAKWRGVVPEVASRAHLEAIRPVVEEALSRAGVTLADLDAIAVTHRPGLIGSLLVGVSFAKALSWAAGIKLIGVDHVQAHLYSVCLGDPRPVEFPAVGLVCSGGHTALYRVEAFDRLELIGRTLDDAVGEAYDKVAAILGLGYPGGPEIDRLAAEGDRAAIRFPRALISPNSLDFSFSGLKTSVLYHVRGYQGREREAASLSPAQLRDVCAGFQAACTGVLVTKIKRAIARTGARSVIVGGGVSANQGLRQAMAALSVPVRIPALSYCTDNAAMVAGLADTLAAKGAFAGLDLACVPSGMA